MMRKSTAAAHGRTGHGLKWGRKVEQQVSNLAMEPADYSDSHSPAMVGGISKYSPFCSCD